MKRSSERLVILAAALCLVLAPSHSVAESDVTGFVNFFNITEDFSLIGIGPENGGVTQYFYIRTNTQIAATIRNAAFAPRVPVGTLVTGRINVQGSGGGIRVITSR